jgi:hypothetical protein
MITLFFIFLALVIISLAAVRNGANSSDGIDSIEWQRRQEWAGFH